MKAVLSRCEFEIAERLALGMTKKEVADKTFRSVHTVETTVRNIYDKLGLKKLSDLVLWYCGYEFNISSLIERRKSQILAIVFLVIFSLDLAINNEEFCRVRRGRRRYEETEILIEV